MKYRKKPVVIEAKQFLGTGESFEEIDDFMEGTLCVNQSKFGDMPFIKTLEGDMTISVGDYIIKGVNGEFYPCKPDIFEKTYEQVCTHHYCDWCDAPIPDEEWEEGNRLCEMCRDADSRIPY